MKRILNILTLYLLVVILSGCNINNSKIVISEVIHSSKLIALELYNTTNKDITLKNYKINIYSNGNTEIDYEIELEGKIESNGFYIITYGNTHSDSNIVSITDLFSTDLKYNGNDTIELTYKNKSITVFGEIGVNVDFGANSSVVKKTEYLKETKYKLIQE
jgi:predicted extracellular nuclease